MCRSLGSETPIQPGIFHSATAYAAARRQHGQHCPDHPGSGTRERVLPRRCNRLIRSLIPARTPTPRHPFTALANGGD
ncbi:hypothetical protein GCM10010411_67630 [Actinomadura fulvescens]|uniref:Uncharacterized protein n=1 Tax=Actinomadura fulvescens TaxID=46160 RepID=A0ABP6CJQ2_9ACTN